jgi:CheY-like chemotaxis protein
MTLSIPSGAPVRKSILVVDDDEEMRAALHGILSPQYHLTLAVDGIDGYEKASALPPHDLIVADVAMPRLDGITMVRRIWAIDALRRIPVIFLTAQLSLAKVFAGLAVGTFACLSKPTDPAVFEMKVRRALSGP